MVYNFTLPPLLLHAFVSQDARLLSEWAAGLTLDSPATTFFNFTASHDGIGVRPLEGILPPEEIDGLVDFVQACGGFVSTKRNSDGSDSPYELNISYVDAIIGQEASMQAERFLASQAIQYALPGVPATYIHSLLGSRNWAEGVQATGRARSINRQKLHVDEVLSALNQPDSFRSRIFHPFVKMMALRRRQPAFHPNAAFHIIDVSPKVFAIFRRSPAQELVALTNISAESVSMERSCLNLDGEVVDLIGGQRIDTTMVELRPYQTLWLTTSQ
jgi:sucrose phosphorylase